MSSRLLKVARPVSEREGRIAFHAADTGVSVNDWVPKSAGFFSQVASIL